MRRGARGESGQAAGVETVPFGILVFVAGTLLVVNAWAVVDTRAAVDSAARDYLRAYTAAPTASAGRTHGDDAARESLGDRGSNRTLVITPPSEAFGPCRPATVRVSLDVPAVRAPFIGSLGTRTVSATQTELVQSFDAAGSNRADGTPARAMAERHERGSTLLLFPAAVVVLLILGSIAVDMSSLYLARRELFRAASQAADDAAQMIDRGAARTHGVIRIDGATAERVVRYELAVARLPGRLVGPPSVDVDDTTNTVTVGATIEVRRVFGRAVPGGGAIDRVNVRVSGRLIDHG